MFGVSPSGNVDYCMEGGADVKTWVKNLREYLKNTKTI